MTRQALILTTAAFLLACSPAPEAGAKKEKASIPKDAAVATFAGGCFWCMEKPFEKLDGVHEVVSGYTGGAELQPTYEQVSRGRTGHAEAVQVHFDPKRVSYEQLLQVFWRQIDPTDGGGQFADRGPHYRTAIWWHAETQRVAAIASKKELEASGRFTRPIVTPIEPSARFWPAEEYHQDYYLKEPARYERYRRGSGRDRFLARVWGGEAAGQASATRAQSRPRTQTAPSSQGGSFGKPSDEVLRARLTPMQYRVTQQEGTEPPFRNEYWDNKRAGIYVDVVSGEPLYSSTHKFVSGTGWPSFWQPLVPENIVSRTDYHLGYPRTELRSAGADSHLGHVFNDGPRPTGERHCINSAALRFIPVDELKGEGYGEFEVLFGRRAGRELAQLISTRSWSKRITPLRPDSLAL